MSGDFSIDDDSDNVKAVSDASWKRLAVPLFEYLKAEPRGIKEILTWCRGRRYTGAMSRHLLAYLSFTNQVHYDPVESVWVGSPEPSITDLDTYKTDLYTR